MFHSLKQVYLTHMHIFLITWVEGPQAEGTPGCMMPLTGSDGKCNELLGFLLKLLQTSQTKPYTN